MEVRSDVIINGQGVPVAGASVLVKTWPAGDLASIFDADGAALGNPFTSQSGAFSFEAPNGKYTTTVSGLGIPATQSKPFVLYDPADDTSGSTFASEIAANTAAISANTTAIGTKVTATDLAAVGGAAAVGFNPAGGISAANVQAALVELDTEKARKDDLAAGTGAGLVGFQPSGAGATPLTAQARFEKMKYADEYASIQQAITAAGSTGTVTIPGSYAGTDSYSNPNNIPVFDLRHQQLGIHSVMAPSYPVASYPFGNDLVLRSRASADTYIEHFHVATTTTTALAVGANLNVPISPVTCGNARFPAQSGTGGAEMFSTLAPLVVGRETANEEQVSQSNWAYVDATHINITCTKTHAGTIDIEQIGSTLLASQDLYIVSSQVKPSQNTTYNAPLRLKDLTGAVIAYIPSDTGSIFPYCGWQWGAVQLGTIGANKDLLYQNALAASQVKWRDHTGTTIASLNDTGYLAVVGGIGSGIGQALISGTNGEVQFGRNNTARTSTTDAFVTWSQSGDPLNPGGTAGSLVLAARNIAGSEVVLASQDTVRLRAGSQGVVLMPQASVTPANNGDMIFQLTSNTSLTIKVKGSDGVVRSTSLTLA